MASMSLIAYSRYFMVRQSGLGTALRITSKTWNPAPIASPAELNHKHAWVRSYAAKKKSDKYKAKKALDDFLEEFDNDEDDEVIQRRPEVIGGKETKVAKFVRECQSAKGKGKKDAKGRLMK